MKRRRRQVFPDTSLSLRRGHTCLLEAITHPCPVTHLAVSPTCPFRRRVCTALLLFGVLFGGWSAQAITYLSFSMDGLQRGHTGHYRPLQAITHLALSPTAPLYSSADGYKGRYLLVLFGGWSAELPYLSYSVRGLQFRALLLVLPSRQAPHMVCTYISPTSFCPFRRMVCTFSPTCPLLPVVHPHPIVSTGQHCVHHSWCPIGPSPWWRCTIPSITIMKVIILLPKEFRPPSPWWTLHSIIIIMKIIILLLSPNSSRLGVVELPG